VGKKGKALSVTQKIHAKSQKMQKSMQNFPKLSELIESITVVAVELSKLEVQEFLNDRNLKEHEQMINDKKVKKMEEIDLLFDGKYRIDNLSEKIEKGEEAETDEYFVNFQDMVKKLSGNDVQFKSEKHYAIFIAAMEAYFEVATHLWMNTNEEDIKLVKFVEKPPDVDLLADAS
jgi:allophanate hydrolase subunit 1